jgi:translation initiation factor RLI1
MPHPVAIIDYQKCQPKKCGDGVCAAAAECPNKVLRQEAAYEFPFSHPSHFCRGCAKCAQAYPAKAIQVV